MAYYCLIDNWQIVGEDAALMAYHSAFRSRMRYGLLLWGNSAHAGAVFTLQKKSVRAIAIVGQQTTCKPLFRKYSILTLPSEYIFLALVHAKEHQNALETRMQTTGINLRHGDRVTLPFHRTHTSAAQHHHLHLLNLLPSSWRNKPINTFKKDLRIWLINECFYSINEYSVAVSHLS